MRNITIIIFGATGDLAKRKIFPALYHLVAKKKLDTFVIIGAALDQIDAVTLLEEAKKYIDNCDQQIWQIVQERTYYKKINVTVAQDFDALAEYVTMCEKNHTDDVSNRLFYCATAAYFFCDITAYLWQSALAKPHDQSDQIWHRLVYEKPFGHDTDSAHAINECIAQHFHESQIYRIDHYLTKEIVNNITMIRFANTVFEPLWSCQYIDQVQIILSETGGIGNRGAYYDHYGALRDVVQNHVMELLALICMETPQRLMGDFISVERAKVIEKIYFIDGFLAQYNGYRLEKDVDPHSTTETYAQLALAIDNTRWNGVPFYIKTGKHLEKKETVIHIRFKQVECLLLRGCPVESNWLTIRVAPDASFILTLNVKQPDRQELVPVGMEFCHSCIFGLQTPEAYEVLLDEVIKGEQSVSVRFDEIEYAWKCIDMIEQKQLPLYIYEPGSAGPEEEKEFEYKHTMKWRS